MGASGISFQAVADLGNYWARGDYGGFFIRLLFLVVIFVILVAIGFSWHLFRERRRK